MKKALNVDTNHKRGTSKLNMTPKHLTVQNSVHTPYVDSGGRKDLVVLTHALNNSLEIWERIYPNLCDKFRVIAFDFQGYGYASRPNVDYDGLFFGSQIGFVLDAMGIEKVLSVGYSVGATAIVHFSKPALVAWGQQDRIFPARYGARVAGLMPQSQLLLVDQCGHYLPWEQSELFANAAKEFLS
jgi:pimeloyl-ACP methyl ester carboxylesterase